MMKPNLVLNRGNVVLVLFPNADLRTAKPRPALIVQADKLQTGLKQVVVAMISSGMFRSNHPSRAVVRLSSSEGKRSGLLSDSVIMTDNLATIAHSEMHKVIGVLPMQEVDAALRNTLGLYGKYYRLLSIKTISIRCLLYDSKPHSACAYGP